MTLTFEELQRIENIEEALIEIQERLNGAASLNALNRLRLLGLKANEETQESNTAIQTKLDQLIALAEKLQ